MRKDGGAFEGETAVKITAEMAEAALHEAVTAQTDAMGGDEPPAPMSRDEIVEVLRWLAATHYNAAVQLTRLRKLGVELPRSDGKDMDRWTVEEVQAGNRFRNARLELEKGEPGRD